MNEKYTLAIPALSHKEIHDGFDRQNLSQIQQRFAAVNAERLSRLKHALTKRQHLVLDALPVIFQTNHPMMPGFVSHETPARIANFQVTKADIQAGKTIARSFTYAPEQGRSNDIDALYVMGSVGTIAQSEHSDLDVWVCHKPGIKALARRELEEKCSRISQWAASMRLEVHFFIMQAQQFREGQVAALNIESSGSAQRHLLLDEFYRSAIHLAGKVPLWWFVPIEHEHEYHDYTEKLLHNRFISEDNVIDFGCMDTIPPGEFIGAGVWQLYKAINSPYKSVLKLLILEAYVNQYPNIKPLSLVFKQRIYEAKLDINELDSYVLIYRLLENYLGSEDQASRLELARRCLYIKVNKPLSLPPKHKQKSWQRIQLEKFVREWSWSELQIKLLDKRSKWKATNVVTERNQLVKELKHCYRLLLEFANSNGSTISISSHELIILGRKLQAAFEKRPDKIDWINPGISDDISEHSLRFRELNNTRKSELIANTSKPQSQQWHVLGDSLSELHDTAIFKSKNLVPTILWAHINQVYNEGCHLELQSNGSIQDGELRKVVNCIADWLPMPMQTPEHAQFKKPAHAHKCLILINVASPLRVDKGEIFHRLSNKADALKYSGFNENLVNSVDIIVQNNWNEVSTRRFEGELALLDAVSNYFQLSLPDTQRPPPALHVECIGSAYSTTISHRIVHLFKEIIRCYYGGKHPPCTRYVFAMAGKFYSMQFEGHRLRFNGHTSESTLIHYLGKAQPQASPIVMDSNAMERHAMATIARHIKLAAINVFYTRFDVGMEVYVVDEKGSVTHAVMRGRKGFNPIINLHGFLRTITHKQLEAGAEIASEFGVAKIYFFELSRDRRGHFSCKERKVPTHNSLHSRIQLIANGYIYKGNKIRYDFDCNGKTFCYAELGDKIYEEVRGYVISQRDEKTPYPVSVSDINLDRCKQHITDDGMLQVSHFLKIKEHVEIKLNQSPK